MNVIGFKRAGRYRISVMALALFIGGCSSTQPSSTISLIPAKTAQQTQRDGMFSQPVRYEHTLPGCSGDCPTLKVDSLAFPGVPKLTQLVDYALATMTGISATLTAPYNTIEGYEQYFWKTAGSRDSVSLFATIRYANRDLTVLELASWQYLTGAAHGITATQFVNWSNAQEKILSLNDLLEPGTHNAYEDALRKVHAQWLLEHPAAKDDPETFSRLWPFQASDNAAITDSGLLVKYDSYQIAPYSSGQPELLIPYNALINILKPQYLPPAQG